MQLNASIACPTRFPAHGKWSEWNGDTWKKNSKIKVKCAGD